MMDLLKYLADAGAYFWVAVMISASTSDFLKSQYPDKKEKGRQGMAVLFVLVCVLAVWWIDS